MRSACIQSMGVRNLFVGGAVDAVATVAFKCGYSVYKV